MRLSIPLVLVSAGIFACDVPTAPDTGRLTPDAPARAVAGGPIASVAGSAQLVPAKGDGSRVTLNAQARADGSATGRFRIDTGTETLTGMIDCLSVSGGAATATGQLDGPVVRKGRDIAIRVREASSSEKGEIPEAAGFTSGAFKKGKGGCPAVAMVVQPTTNGHFVIRGSTDAVKEPPTKGGA